MPFCPNCGTQVDEDKKFCRICGSPTNPTDEEIRTWRLSPRTTPDPSQSTTPIWPSDPAQSQQSYVPPPQYPMVQESRAPRITLGRWLSEGWDVFRTNWALMSLATLVGGFLSVITLGVLAGPLLMGMYRMAFKTIRQDRPELSDLFQWEGRFLQSLLAFLIFALLRAGLMAVAPNEGLAALLNLVVSPVLTMLLGLSIPLILERRHDVANAVNTVGRTIFNKDVFMWWLVGLVFAAISAGGVIGCGVGLLITVPWIICASAVAYRDIYGLDDPNRTSP